MKDPGEGELGERAMYRFNSQRDLETVGSFARANDNDDE